MKERIGGRGIKRERKKRRDVCCGGKVNENEIWEGKRRKYNEETTKEKIIELIILPSLNQTAAL